MQALVRQTNRSVMSIEAGPIFIGGLSYSGKTYLRLMLSAHSSLSITRRTKMWRRYYGRYGDLTKRENFERCLKDMLQAKHVQELHPDPDRIRREFFPDMQTYAQLFSLFHAHNAERLGKRRWGDQMGKVEEYADIIFEAFPTARIIHMMRDVRERCQVSIATPRYRRAKLGWETAEWRHSARLAQRNVARYPERYLIVNYEALLGCREQTLRHICAFIHESFSPDMLRVDGVPAMENFDPDRGRPEITPDREMVLLQSRLRNEMTALDYQPRSIQISVEDWLLLALVDLPFNLAGQALWWVREGVGRH